MAKGQSVSFAVRDDEIELVRGSMKTLKMQHGDLLVVRLAKIPNEEIHNAIKKHVSVLLRETGRRAVSIVMSSDVDFEMIPHEIAVELLTELTKRKANENVDNA